nr:diguanylate cyclase [Wenzhouxiangella sp. XN79A]
MALVLCAASSTSRSIEPAELADWNCEPDAVDAPAERLDRLAAMAEALPAAPAELPARWHYCRATALEMAGRLDEARAAYTDATEAHAELPDTTADHVRSLLGRSYVDYLQTNDPARYCADRAEAVRLARRLDAPRVLIEALTLQAFCFGQRPADLDEGLARLDEALQIARTEGLDPGETAMIHNATANLYRRNQLLDLADRQLALAHDAWAAEDDRQDMFNMLHGRIQVAIQRGRWDDAERHLESMRALTERSPSFADFPFFLAFNRGAMELARGDHQAAITALDRALALEGSTGERYFVATTLRLLARAHFQAGNPTEAAGHARAFLALGEPPAGDPGALSATAIAAYADGDPAAALRTLLRALDAEQAAGRDRMQRNAASQATLHDQRIEDFQSAILREQLANRELQLQQARQQQQTSRVVNVLAAAGALVLAVLVGFLLWSRHRFREHARTDALTGVANRRYAMERAERLFAQSVDSGDEFALLLLDLDHFKSINDRHGHDAGDRVLQGVVRAFLQALPGDAVLGRLGGEEFLIALPGSDRARALAQAERVRRAVADRPIDAGVSEVALTVSIGVAARGAATASLNALYRRADQALYAAKHDGRDRSSVDIDE